MVYSVAWPVTLDSPTNVCSRGSGSKRPLGKRKVDVWFWAEAQPKSATAAKRTVAAMSSKAVLQVRLCG